MNQLSKELAVGTLILATHRDGTSQEGIVLEVYDETLCGPALVFYQHKRRRNVLRVGQGESYDLVMPDKQLAPGVIVLDRIDGVEASKKRPRHCDLEVHMEGDELFYKTWRCSSGKHWGVNVFATCSGGCSRGWCEECYTDRKMGLVDVYE